MNVKTNKFTVQRRSNPGNVIGKEIEDTLATYLSKLMPLDINAISHEQLLKLLTNQYYWNKWRELHPDSISIQLEKCVGQDFDQYRFDKVTFIQSNFEDCSFSKIIGQPYFKKTAFDKCSFKNIAHIELNEVKITDTVFDNFTASYFGETIFKNTKFINSLIDCDIRHSEFIECEFTDIDFFLSIKTHTVRFRYSKFFGSVKDNVSLPAAFNFCIFDHVDFSNISYEHSNFDLVPLLSYDSVFKYCNFAKVDTQTLQENHSLELVFTGAALKSTKKQTSHYNVWNNCYYPKKQTRSWFKRKTK